MMTPRKEHDWVAGLLGRMIEALMLALDLPIQSIGSTTLRAANGGRGIQPYLDEPTTSPASRGCIARVVRSGQRSPHRIWRSRSTSRKSSLPRMPVFAAIGVPEVWRFTRGRLRFHRLGKAEYDAAQHSLAFPFLTPPDLMRFVSRRVEVGEAVVVREFVEWAVRANTPVRTKACRRPSTPAAVEIASAAPAGLKLEK